MGSITSIFGFIAVSFILFIYALWMIGHCVRAKDMNTKSKVIWTVAMLLVWPVAGIIYGIVSSKDEGIRMISFAAIFLGAVLTFFVIQGINQGSRLVRAMMVLKVSELQQNNLSELDKEQVQFLNESLNIVEKEVGAGLLQREKKFKALILYQLYSKLVKDKKITLAEFLDWKNSYNTRETMDAKEFRKVLASYK